METLTAKNNPANIKDAAKFENHVNHTVLMSNDYGVVNLMVLKRGQEIPTHVAPSDAMVHVIEGRVDFTIDASHYVLREGEYLTMSKGTPHSVSAVEDAKIVLTLLGA